MLHIYFFTYSVKTKMCTFSSQYIKLLIQFTPMQMTEVGLDPESD